MRPLENPERFPVSVAGWRQGPMHYMGPCAGGCPWAPNPRHLCTKPFSILFTAMHVTLFVALVRVKAPRMPPSFLASPPLFPPSSQPLRSLLRSPAHSYFTHIGKRCVGAVSGHLLCQSTLP